jgi:SAM-dependent methyltransferase
MQPGLSAAFHDRLAPDYDRQMSSFADAAVRGAFQTFVSARLPPGSRILDFGCGTGTDASWYATRGYRVLAFDNSPGMIGELRSRCADAIARGEIEPWSDTYEAFLGHLVARGDVQAVTANFAVINLVPDLTTWFDAISRALPPGAAVFLSALNPLSLHDLRAPRRLLEAARFAFDAGVPSPDALNPHTKYWPWAIARAARGFRLDQVAGAGFLVGGEGKSDQPGRLQRFSERIERHLGHRRPWSHLGRFVFLELRRC